MGEYFLRIEGNSFGFVVEGIHEIMETDKKITKDEYEEWNELSSYKSFKVKEVATGTRLFDYIEEYSPEQPQQEVGINEFMLDVDYRISKLELGV